MSGLPSRSNLLVAAVLIATVAASSLAQTPQGAAAAVSRLRDSARVLMDKAVPTGDLDALKRAEALLDRALTVAPHDPWLQHYLGLALYREAGISMGLGRDTYMPILERADSVLERTASANIPESHALRAGVLGMMIGSNPLRGMTLGPKSGAQMERALALGPNNPRVWLLRGIGAYNTPAMFGGGMDKAEEYLLKSIALYANDKPQPPAPAWGQHEAHLWLGRVYASEDKVDAARASYQKALALEPNDVWIRSVLLPGLDKKK